MNWRNFKIFLFSFCALYSSYVCKEFLSIFVSRCMYVSFALYLQKVFVFSFFIIYIYIYMSFILIFRDCIAYVLFWSKSISHFTFDQYESFESFLLCRFSNLSSSMYRWMTVFFYENPKPFSLHIVHETRKVYVNI